MCGISGIIGPDWQASQLEAMVEAQHHRGPDARGYFVEENVAGLGHNRLSIIDLSEAGNQPMHSADGQLVMVFNGEVYNYLELKAQLEHRYVFRTQTDSEVVLAAYQEWGAACLDKFIGMFSFAIWHRKEKKLFAARDRFGVKPFHYSVNTGRFYFASEIKALWAAGLPKRPNEPVWASYLTYGTYGMPNETFWVGVHQLPGGHFLEWKGDKITTVRWYDFENRLPSLPELSEQDAADQWLALARESIRLRFRADVPVGFNLSGGLDSSLLLGLVHQAYANNSGIKAFHFYTGDERYDELPWVRDMIAQTSFPLQTVRLEVEQVPQLAQQVAIHQDEPYGGIPTLAYSLIFQEARKKGTLVLLDGQGVDEALAGYDYYRQIGNNSIV